MNINRILGKLAAFYVASYAATAIGHHGLFELRSDSDAALPTYRVAATQGEKVEYDTVQVASDTVPFEYRGRCEKGYLEQFTVYIDGNANDVPVNTSNRSLSGDKGHKWRKHELETQPVDLFLYGKCNQKVQQLVSGGSTLKDALNTQKVLDVNLELSGKLACNKKTGFDPLDVYANATVPAKVICESAGFVPELEVNDIALTVTSMANKHSGSCKLKMEGGIQTNLLDIQETNRSLKYRYVFESNGFEYQKSPWVDASATSANYGNVALSYLDDIPNNNDDLHSGKIFVEVDTGAAEKTLSQKVSYSMECAEEYNVVLDTHISPKVNIEVKPVKKTKVWRQNQWCPTEAKVVASVTAGSDDLAGKAVFIGTVITDIQVQDVTLAPKKSKKYTVKKTLGWPTAQNTLVLQGANQQLPLQSTELTQRFNLTDPEGGILASVPPQTYTLSCWEPQVNEGLSTVDGLVALPDHTGGGAPTDLAGNPANTTGLATQGRLIVDSDLNESKVAQPAAPVPTPYPTVSERPNEGAQEYKPKLDNVMIKSWSTSGDADDRSTDTKPVFGSQVNSMRADKHSSENAKGGARNHQLTHTEQQREGRGASGGRGVVAYEPVQVNGKTFNRYKGNLGDVCDKASFKTHSLVLKRGVFTHVDCQAGRVRALKTLGSPSGREAVSSNAVRHLDMTTASPKSSKGSASKDLANESGERQNALLLPAVQKAREAARSTSRPAKLTCQRVSRRISVCGSTNFRNRVSAGIGIHFSKSDRQSGQFSAEQANIERDTRAGKHIYITEGGAACKALRAEKSLRNSKNEAYADCTKLTQRK